MNWNQVFADVVAQIGTAAAIVTALAVIGKIAVEKFFAAGVETLKAELKRSNDLELARVKNDFALALQGEKARNEVEKVSFQQYLEDEATARDRIRREILAWANPILNSVYDLEARFITNILHKGGFEALDPRSATADPNWSSSHDYFLHSTMYLFARYFCWVYMLQEELSFELFRSDAD